MGDCIFSNKKKIFRDLDTFFLQFFFNRSFKLKFFSNLDFFLICFFEFRKLNWADLYDESGAELEVLVQVEQKLLHGRVALDQGS